MRKLNYQILVINSKNDSLFNKYNYLVRLDNNLAEEYNIKL